MLDNIPTDIQTRILIVDDDYILQHLLQEFLQQHDFYVSTVHSGEALVHYLTSYEPDLILLDVLLPDGNGLDWLKWLKLNKPNIPVMILSVQSSHQDRIEGLLLGAVDYLAKPFHPTELLIRIRNILRIVPTHEVGWIKVGHCLFDASRELLIKDKNYIKLTTAETRLLLFFCQNAGKILTRDAISQALHGVEHNPLDRSIDMQVNRLRKKLEDNESGNKHLFTVWRKGYRFLM